MRNGLDTLYSYLKFSPIIIGLLVFGRGCFRDEITVVAEDVSEKTTAPIVETMQKMKESMFINSQGIIALTEGLERAADRHDEFEDEAKVDLKECMERLETRLDKLEERIP
jgi:hypothetical protein